ncbi:MAG: hypothetical protein JAY67_12815 [Candidatus Thiodiazotropha taylori]|nr:hypothetical protein [Candidatus Thiodiazotropha taylori]
MSYKRYFLLNCVALLFITSCGGGGGSGDEPETTNTNSSNEGLSGYLFSQGPGNYAYLLDALSGSASVIANTDWSSQENRFPGGLVKFRKRAVQNDHSYFLVNAIHCKKENEDSLARDMSCIYLQDYDGNFIDGFDLLHDVYELQMSYDYQYIALFRDFNHGSTNQEWFEIYTRNGDLLSYRRLESRKIRWFRDGRIMYLDGPRFVITKPYSTEGDRTMTLPENISNGGWLSDFDISNDEMQIAFTVATDSTAFTSIVAKAYVMNIDGTNIRLLADVPEGDPKITSPSWSPDGRWILLEEGYVTGQDSDVLGASGNLYVVPAEDQGKVYMLSTVSNERSKEVIPFIHDIDGPGSSTVFNTKSYGEAFEWIP